MRKDSIKYWPLVPCAGAGSRSGADIPKQYVMLEGQPVVAHTLKGLRSLACLELVTIVLAPDDTIFSKICSDFLGNNAKVGGDTRAQSVRAGLKVLREQGAQDDDWVLVHDAARCLIQPQWVLRLIESCQNDAVGGLLAYPVPDTMKQAKDGRSISTVSRQDKWLAQTPQMFRLALLEKALGNAFATGLGITDEASAVEALGLSPLLVACSADNFKLTYPDDFERAAVLLRARRLSESEKQ